MAVTSPLSRTELPGIELRTNVQLAEYTTLRLGGPADRFAEVTEASELVEVIRVADKVGEPLLVLGGGSNMVIADEGFAGLVVHIATAGRQVTRNEDGATVLTVEAGEDWDALVADTVDQGLGGLECLSGIPGLVGATPVQNVGAYGVEIADLLVSIDMLDRRSGQIRELSADQLGFAYRASVLKGTDSAVVLRARFKMSDDGLSAPIRYPELAELLGVAVGVRVPVSEARQGVLALRHRKAMVLDPENHDTWSAGSFFTNPIVPDNELLPILQRIAERVGMDAVVPRYVADPGYTKLSAGWLIEQAGFARGYVGPGGRVGLSTKHALSLTNRGAGSTTELLALARQIRDEVRATFGVMLSVEPLLIGCAL